MLAKISLVVAVAASGFILAPANADAGELMRRIENRLSAAAQRMALRAGQRAANNPELQRKAAKIALSAGEKAAKDPVIQKEISETLARIVENAAADPKTREIARETLEGMLKSRLD